MGSEMCIRDRPRIKNRPMPRTRRKSIDPAAGVLVTGITNEDSLFLYSMAAQSISRARVDGVLEVEAFADGISFDDSVTHFVWYLEYRGNGLMIEGWLLIEREEEANQSIEWIEEVERKKIERTRQEKARCLAKE